MMNTPTPSLRAIVEATLTAAFPAAPKFAIDQAIDEIAMAATTADVAAATPGVVTGDTLPTPAPTPGPCETMVEVVAARSKSFDDSGEVRFIDVVAVGGDGTVIGVRFDDKRKTAWEIALRALGADHGCDIATLVGRRATVVLAPWTGRDGVERVGVQKWIAPRAPARTASMAAPAGVRKAVVDRDAAPANAEPRLSRNAKQHPVDDEIPF